MKLLKTLIIQNQILMQSGLFLQGYKKILLIVQSIRFIWKNRSDHVGKINPTMQTVTIFNKNIRILIFWKKT